MPIGLLPEIPTLRIFESGDAPTGAQLEREEHLIVIASEGLKSKAWRDVPHADRLKKMLRRASDRHAVPAVSTTLPNKAHTGVTLAFIGADASAFQRLTTARKLVADAMRQNPARIGLLLPGMDAGGARKMAEACAAALLAAAFPMPHLKSKTPPAPRLRSLRVFGLSEAMDIARLQAEAEGNNLARWLAALPANELSVSGYRQRIEALAESNGWKLKVLDQRALARRGAGAFLAVAQGSAKRDAFIAHLSYRPDQADPRPPLCLVGKGICFDTGGVNLKPATYMQTMNEDMGGSAVVLGLLLALTRLGAPRAVDAWLAVTENSISGAAYKPQDVITASNGTTIEVIHTDAEGRMVLADTLALAAKDEPALIMDFATLTGACVGALTTAYSGVFSNRRELNAVLTEAGRDSGERVWPFPVDDDFDHHLDSELADIKQCSLDGKGDHILATRFLGRFAGQDIPWVHVDLAASRSKGGLAHVPSDVTGFGVRFGVNLLIDQGLIDS